MPASRLPAEERASQKLIATPVTLDSDTALSALARVALTPGSAVVDKHVAYGT